MAAGREADDVERGRGEDAAVGRALGVATGCGAALGRETASTCAGTDGDGVDCAGADAARASKAAADTGTSETVADVSDSFGTMRPPTVICNASGRAVRIIGPVAPGGTV